VDQEGSALPRIPPPPRPPRQAAKRSVEIWAITPQEIVRGSIHCLDGQRMSDALNDVLSTTLRGPRTRFLPLTDVAIQPIGSGVPSATAFSALNKSQVLLIGEVGSPPAVKSDEKRSGTTVTVRLNLVGGHSVNGTVYCQSGRRTIDVLNDEREFLPMVDVVAKLAAGVARRFAFVAINKTHIHRLEELG
jgi:hypothetical protein